MSHHNPMELGLFKTETLWVTEDNQAIQNNALDGQHSEKVFKPELCLLLIFLFYTLNRLRTKQCDRLLFTACPWSHSFQSRGWCEPVSESGWGTACDTSQCGSWTSRLFSLQTVELK